MGAAWGAALGVHVPFSGRSFPCRAGLGWRCPSACSEDEVCTSEVIFRPECSVFSFPASALGPTARRTAVV